MKTVTRTPRSHRRVSLLEASLAVVLAILLSTGITYVFHGGATPHSTTKKTTPTTVTAQPQPSSTTTGCTPASLAAAVKRDAPTERALMRLSYYELTGDTSATWSADARMCGYNTAWRQGGGGSATVYLLN